MCRGIDHGGRRCPADTSEARRLRRHNAAGKAKAEGFLTDSTTTLTREVTEPTSFTAPISTATMENVHEAVADLTQARNILETLHTKEHTDKVITFSDGNVLTVTKYNIELATPAGDVILEGPQYSHMIDVCEYYTTQAGNSITLLIEERLGFKFEDIEKEEKAGIDLADLVFKEKKKNYDDLVAEMRVLYPADPTKGTYYAGTSLATLMNAVKNEDPDAVEFYQKYMTAREEWNTASAKLGTLAYNGSELGVQRSEQQRAELVKILTDLRGLGGEVQVATNSHKKASKILSEAVSLYPSSWIEASNAAKPPRIKSTSKRAHYTNGAWQKSYKVVDKKQLTIRDEGWEPDPTSRWGKPEMWHKVDGDEWTDPVTGIKHSALLHKGEVAWVETKTEYYSHWPGSDREVKPHGKGWVKTQVEKTVWNSELHRSEPAGMETAWYRPIKTRVQTEAVSQPELTISGGTEKGQKQTALHEFAHRIESTPKLGNYITQLEESFLERRTTNQLNGEREELQQIYPKTKEYGRADKFIDLYMGKEYTNSAIGYREILSTGAESVFGGSFGGLVGLGRKPADKDMYNFIVGLWATA